MRKDKRVDIIKCPCCGAEYLPGEIYLPKDFLGQPKYVEKTYLDGKIMYYGGNSMNLEEHYVCDRCNTAFKVTAKVQFSTQEEKVNFNDDYYVQKGHKNSLFLNEE